MPSKQIKKNHSHHKFPRTIIGLDVETTSLDPATGEIIEVAAIRFDTKTGRVVDRYNELCQPSAPLTAEITAITHITNDMLQDKAPFSSHVAKLKQFIGRDTVFAHNASFDINYLAEHGLKINNPVWDTFALASIAWPETDSYNLGLLFATYVEPTLSVKPKKQGQSSKTSAKKAPSPPTTSEQEHRAGYDVQLTWQLLQTIRHQLSVSPSAFQKIEHVLSSANLSQYLPLFTKNKSTTPPSSSKLNKPISTASAHQKLTLKNILGPQGIMAQHPPFAYREQQMAMAETVMEIFNNDEIGLIEAGTGTGKTYGYLVPLLLHILKSRPSQAKSTSRSVSIISTYTKHLQDQLFSHDLPRLLRLLNIKLRIAVLKGRRNYLCTGRLSQTLQKANFSPEEAMFLVKLVVWLEQVDSGDLERLNLSHQAARYTYHLHADSISCRNNCPTDNPTCPYHVARQQAKQADLVIINHALLVQLGTDDSAFSLDKIVIDEAHHLEDAAREATTRDLSPHMLAEVIAPFVQLARSKPKTSRHRITQEAQSIIDEYQQLLQAIASFLTDHARINLLRLNPSVRRSTKWQRVVEQGTAWRSRLQFLIGLTQGMTTKPSDNEKYREAISGAENFSRDFASFLNGDSGRIQWLDLYSFSANPADSTLTLNDVTLSVQPLLKNLFGGIKSAVLTSATLTVGHKYDYIKRRLGITEAKEFIYGSSFDYKKQMLVYIVDDAPAPNDSGYPNFISRQFINLSKLTSGRLLGLFTSHLSVKDVYRSTLKELNKAKIKILAQKLTGGRHNIIKKFQHTHSSILLGTYSFWEGIDIPGESLSSVVIVKLPFSPPHDPIIDAIAEDEKISSFNNLSVPTMILRLRQGIGRLIRSQDDFGVVVILDSRFLQQDYGRQVLASLPPATVQIGSTNELMPTLTNWFGAEQLEQWKNELEHYS